MGRAPSEVTHRKREYFSYLELKTAIGRRDGSDRLPRLSPHFSLGAHCMKSWVLPVTAAVTGHLSDVSNKAPASKQVQNSGGNRWDASG